MLSGVWVSRRGVCCGCANRGQVLYSNVCIHMYSMKYMLLCCFIASDVFMGCYVLCNTVPLVCHLYFAMI